MAAEIMVLRQQESSFPPKSPTRPHMRGIDKGCWDGSVVFPKRAAGAVVRRRLLRWNQAGFRTYCAGSRGCTGRTAVSAESEIVME